MVKKADGRVGELTSYTERARRRACSVRECMQWLDMVAGDLDRGFALTMLSCPLPTARADPRPCGARGQKSCILGLALYFSAHTSGGTDQACSGLPKGVVILVLEWLARLDHRMPRARGGRRA